MNTGAASDELGNKMKISRYVPSQGRSAGVWKGLVGSRSARGYDSSKSKSYTVILYCSISRAMLRDGRLRTAPCLTAGRCEIIKISSSTQTSSFVLAHLLPVYTFDAPQRKLPPSQSSLSVSATSSSSEATWSGCNVWGLRLRAASSPTTQGTSSQR